MEGWISLHRKILDNPVVCKDSDYFSTWCYLLLNATHKSYNVIFEGKKIALKPGQLITGRKSIAEKLKINESKVQRILKSFENEQQIEQQTAPRNRLISIVNWNLYQQSEQQNEQQVNNKRTTNEQQMNTNNNDNNVDNVDNGNNNISLVIQYYENNITSITETSYIVLKDYLQVMDYKLVIEAIKIAKERNVRNINYVRSILNNWNKSGYTCLEDLNKDKHSNKTKRASDIIENFEKEIEDGD